MNKKSKCAQDTTQHISFNGAQMEVGDIVFAVVGRHLRQCVIESFLTYTFGSKVPLVKMVGLQSPVCASKIIK